MKYYQTSELGDLVFCVSRRPFSNARLNDVLGVDDGNARMIFMQLKVGCYPRVDGYFTVVIAPVAVMEKRDGVYVCSSLLDSRSDEPSALLEIDPKHRP